MKISHSKAQKFLECSQAYDYQYNQKLRSRVTSSALLFGSAVDHGLNYIFEHMKAGQPYELNKAIEVFKTNWVHAKVNNVLTDIMNSDVVVYAKTDFDADILTKEDQVLLTSKIKELNLGYLEVTHPIELVGTIKKLKEQHEHRKFTDNEAKYLNIASWLSALRKGCMFIEQYHKEIIPQIKEVISYQREIAIKDDNGNTITGFIDLICKWSDNSIVVFDNKTARQRYNSDEVRISEQLATYRYATENELKTVYGVDDIKCGYIVLVKQLNKERHKECRKCGFTSSGRHTTCNNTTESDTRCGGQWLEQTKSSVDIQVLIDTINDQTEKVVLSNYEKITQLMEIGIYVRNTHACIRNTIICPYYDLCWKNSKKNLVEV